MRFVGTVVVENIVDIWEIYDIFKFLKYSKIRQDEIFEYGRDCIDRSE